jgi:hypothetical protein
MRTPAVLLFLGLGACAHNTKEPFTVYQEVDKAVATSCVPAGLGPLPAGLLTREQLSAITDGPSRYVALAADWMARVARMEETEGVVAGCRKAPP